MNHGIAATVLKILNKREWATAGSIADTVTRYHRRFCDCHMPEHRVRPNVLAMLANEVHRPKPRWERLDRGVYQRSFD